MRKIGLLGMILVLLVIGGVLYSQVAFPCARPVRYSLGTFDARFGITRDEFLKVAARAETLWEKPAGAELFMYDPEARFTLNLIYDERQARTNEYTQIQKTLEQSENLYKTTKEEYDALNVEYDEKRIAYEAEVKDYNADRLAYNEEVDYWNNHGGAPSSEYNALKKKQEALNKRGEEIDEDREELNALGRRLNVLSSEANSFANSHNDIAATYNQKFGTTSEFDQGEYTGNEIDIYEFKGLSDLEVVLTHEFGHALGIDHVDDPEAIMYYLMGEQDLNVLHTTNADIAAMRDACRFSN